MFVYIVHLSMCFYMCLQHMSIQRAPEGSNKHPMPTLRNTISLLVRARCHLKRNGRPRRLHVDFGDGNSKKNQIFINLLHLEPLSVTPHPSIFDGSALSSPWIPIPMILDDFPIRFLIVFHHVLVQFYPIFLVLSMF